jgi:hypothetical protein
MAKEVFDIPAALRDEVIAVVLAGLRRPPRSLPADACAQIRSWCEVNLVGTPDSDLAYGVPEYGLPQFIALLRAGLRRQRTSRRARRHIETWCAEEAAYYERYYGRPCIP